VLDGGDMRGSLKLGRFAGIDVFVHWTFAILLAWIFLLRWSESRDVVAAFGGVVFLLAIFGCVVLHEFGHALTARRYGIMTRDITLLPIGGLARLERMPENPWHEFWVALAGPAVNVVIALAAYIVLRITGGLSPDIESALREGGFLEQLMLVNVILVAFNLLPAFPMDGGRVLRAVLAVPLGRRRATRIAAGIGQMMAVVFGLFGLFVAQNPFMLFIAIFVFIGAQAEARQVGMTSLMQGMTVRDAMLTRFRVLSASDPLATAVDELLAGSQQDFPVVDESGIVGVLRRQDLVKGLAEHGKQATVGSAMTRVCPAVDSAQPLQQAFEQLQSQGCTVAPVMESGRVVGLLTMENIGERVMVASALETEGQRARGEARSTQ
jgi:Zn-dependent protease/predicted transcriptional regulator